MDCFTVVSSVANTEKKINIHSYSHYGYIHNFYHDKQDIVDEPFLKYHRTLLKYIDYPSLIKE